MVHMKRIIATGSVAALALVGFAGTASAGGNSEPKLDGPGCFGQVHKLVNSGGLAGIENVGQLVQSFPDKGQGKNATAKTFC
jgi:hypothetical protein